MGSNMTFSKISLCLLLNTIPYFVSGQTQSSLAFSALQASESSLAFAAQALDGKLDFDCSAYDCLTKGINVLCIPSSTDYDEESCPFAKYCCSDDENVEEDDVEVIISLDDTALINLWLLVGAFIITNAFVIVKRRVMLLKLVDAQYPMFRETEMERINNN